MHTEKQKIFDSFSSQEWKSTFEEFLDVTILEVTNFEISKDTAINQIKELVFAACDLVQKEQQKRIAEKLPKGEHIFIPKEAAKDMIISNYNLIK